MVSLYDVYGKRVFSVCWISRNVIAGPGKGRNSNGKVVKKILNEDPSFEGDINSRQNHTNLRNDTPKNCTDLDGAELKVVNT